MWWKWLLLVQLVKVEMTEVKTSLGDQMEDVEMHITVFNIHKHMGGPGYF